MARLIEIKNGILSASVAPDNGGMLTSLKIGETEVLSTFSNLLDISPMMAGGCPVLFPFPSRTAGDLYTVDGRAYGMPFHGLVKNASFAIREQITDRITLFITDNPAWLASQYPFSFELELVYELKENCLLMTADIQNRGNEALFHGFGWHPFFKATDKAACRLIYYCNVNYDYVNHIDSGPAPKNMDLSLSWDNVLHTMTRPEFTFENPADGYAVRCSYDKDFEALVVCSTQDGAVCIEPWCGIPNTANILRMAKFIAPGDTRSYKMQLTLKELN